ncbi:MAG: hypothetical protein AB9879_07515 [Methanothrix sp.]
MTMLNLSGRSANMGPKLLLSCLLLCLLMCGQAAAQDKNVTCIAANVPSDENAYAELAFCLAPQVSVEPEQSAVANYTSGREVRTSLLLNGSRAVVHLLYPCRAPQSMLDAAAMKSLLDAYDSAMASAVYSNETLAVGGMPAYGGMVGDQIFVAYQPTNQTPVLVQLDGNMDEENMVAFLQYLRITLKEGTSPLIAGYCPDTTATTTTPAATAQVDTQTAAANALANSQVATQTTPAETRAATFESKKEKMASDIEAAKEKLASAKEKMRGF